MFKQKKKSGGLDVIFPGITEDDRYCYNQISPDDSLKTQSNAELNLVGVFFFFF